MLVANKVIEDFRRYSQECFPYEALGYVIDDTFKPLKNESPNSAESFLTTEDIPEQAICFLHSHTDGSFLPSYMDMRTQIALGIPLGVMGVYYDNIENEFHFTSVEYVGMLKKNYLNLPYIFGINDCYSLIRNWYFVHKNIELIDIPRRWEFWKYQNLFVESFTNVGFKEISRNEVEEGDVCLITLRHYSHFPIHCGIVLNDEMIVHHPSDNRPINYSRLSKKESIHRILPTVSHWLRYDRV